MIKPKFTIEELDALNARLPRGSKTAIARLCNCSQAKVTRVFKGHFTDTLVIEVALKLAEKYEEHKSIVVARVDSLITKVQ